MSRKCGGSSYNGGGSCGMSQGLYNPFFQNGAYWYGQGGSEPPDEITFEELNGLLYLFNGATSTMVGLPSTEVDTFHELGNLLYIYNGFK